MVVDVVYIFCSMIQIIVVYELIIGGYFDTFLISKVTFIGLLLVPTFLIPI